MEAENSPNGSIDCSSFPEEIRDFRRWYHGVLSRQDAEDRLKRQERPFGYLVRKSDKPQMRNSFVLSVCLKDMECQHYDITCAYGVLEIGGHSFTDMRSILNLYYVRNLTDRGERLEFPVGPDVELMQPDAEYFKAIQSYKSDTVNVLSFEKGDIFIKKSTPHECEGYVYVSCLNSLNNGYVPISFVTTRYYPEFVSRLSYFHPEPISTEELTDMMVHYGEGSFLLRPSEREPGSYALQCLFRTIRKFIIRPCMLEDAESVGMSPCSDDAAMSADRCQWGLDNSDGEDRDLHRLTNKLNPYQGKRFIFKVSQRSFESIEAIVEHFQENDVYAGGYRLKTPIPYNPSMKRGLKSNNNILPSKEINDNEHMSNGVKENYCHEQLYHSFRHQETFHYSHPDKAGVEFQDSIYMLVLTKKKPTKKYEWVQCTGNVDIQNCLLLEPHLKNGKNCNPELIQLANANYYPIHRSLIDSPYSFLIVPRHLGEHNAVQYLLCVQPSSDVDSDPILSTHRVPNYSALLNSNNNNAPSSSSTFMNNSIHNSVSSKNFSSSFTSMPFSNATSHVPHSHSQQNTVHRSDILSNMCSGDMKTQQQSNLERYETWIKKILPHCKNTCSQSKSSEEGIPIREHFELLVDVQQVSAPESLFVDSALWCCYIFIGSPEGLYRVARTGYETYSVADSVNHRRTVEWKREFLFDHVPRNVDRIVFALYKKKIKNAKRDPESIIGHEHMRFPLMMKAIEPVWASDSPKIAPIEIDEVKLTFNVSYSKLYVRQNISYYQSLIDVLMDHMDTDLAPLSSLTITKKHLSACLLRVAIRKGQVFRLIHELVAFQYEKQASHFFRCDNLGVTILRDYILQSCVGWLRCVFARLVQFICKRRPLTSCHEGAKKSNLQRQVSINEDMPNVTTSNETHEALDEALLIQLVEGIAESTEALPLRVRYICQDLREILTSDKSVKQEESCAPRHVISSQCEQEGSSNVESVVVASPVSPISHSSKPLLQPECLIAINLFYLRIISPSLSTGYAISPSGHLSTWEGNPNHPLRDVLEQLYALYFIKLQLGEGTSLADIAFEDRHLTEDEFLTKHFNSPETMNIVMKNRFPRKEYEQRLIAVSKMLVGSSYSEIKSKLSRFQEFLKKDLTPEEERKLFELSHKETEEKIKQSSWTQDMAEIEGILQLKCNHQKLEDSAPYFKNLLPVLDKLGSFEKSTVIDKADPLHE